MSIDGSLSEIFAKYGNFSQHFIHMSAEEAQAVAVMHYGVSGQVRHLPTEKDDTFHIRCGPGHAFILKVEHPCEPAGDVVFQTALLDYLRDTAQDLNVPRVIRGGNGDAIVRHVDRAGQVRQVRLLSYLEGVPIEHIPSSADGRRKIGVKLAQLRHGLAGFAHPGADRTLIWDVRCLPDLRALLSFIDAPSHRARAETAMARFVELLPAIAALRTQILHNDFNRSNILAVSRQDETIAGIIDFGDALRTAIAIDVSTAMANQLPLEVTSDAATFLCAPRDVLRGYLNHADLMPEEVSMLGHLMMARLLLRALISTWRAMVFPENRDYILRYSQVTWEQMTWFVERDVKTVSETFMPDASIMGRNALARSPLPPSAWRMPSIQHRPPARTNGPMRILPDGSGCWGLPIACSTAGRFRWIMARVRTCMIVTIMNISTPTTMLHP